MPALRVIALASLLVGACGDTSSEYGDELWFTWERKLTAATDAESRRLYVVRLEELRGVLAKAGFGLDVSGPDRTELRTSACEGKKLEMTDPQHGGLLIISEKGCYRCALASADGTGPVVDSEVIRAFTDGLRRYPRSYLLEGRLQNVAICNTITPEHDGDTVDLTGGTIDLAAGRMLLSLEPFAGYPYDPEGFFTAEDSLNHELFHLVDFGMAPGTTLTDPEWVALNSDGFAYGSVPDDEAVAPGFFNTHAMKSPREDKATVFQYMMARPEKTCEVVQTDPVIQRKVLLLRERVTKAIGETDAAFIDRRVRCLWD